MSEGSLALLDATLKSTALLAVAWVLALVFRKCSGRVHHLLWTATFLGILALGVSSVPKVDAVKPAWRWARLTLPIPSMADLAVPSPAPAPPAFLTPAAPGSPRTAETAPAVRTGSSPAPATPHLGGWIGLWALGAFLVLARCFGGLFLVARLSSRARRLAGPHWAAVLEDAKTAVGVRREVLLLHSDEISSPMTGGWWRPRILLPPETGSWADERLRLVLIHELVHVRRGDWLVQLLAQLASAIYWPSPLVWLARRRLVEARERSCDERVIALGARPSDYASHLLDIAQSMSARLASRRPTPATALAMIHRNQLEGRLMSILSSHSPARHRPLATLVAGLVALLVVPLATFDLRADAREDEESGGEPRSAWTGNWSMSTTLDGGLHVSMSSTGGGSFGEHGVLELEDGATAVLETSRLAGSTQRMEITRRGDERVVRFTIDNLEQPVDRRAEEWRDTVFSILGDLQQKGALRGREGALRGQIGALRGREGALRGQIGAVKGEEGALRGQIGAVRGREGALRGKIGALRGQEGALRGKLGALAGQMSALRQKRAALARLDQKSAELGRLDEELGARADEMRALEAELASFDLEAKVAEVQRQMEDVELDGRVAELERKITDLAVAERTAELERQIVGLKMDEELAALQAKIEALRVEEHLAAIDDGLAAKAEQLHHILDELGC